MSKEAIAHYEAALKEAFPRGATGEVFHHWNEARCLIATEALDKMAENARELGLDYDVKSDHRLMAMPAQQEPVAWGVFEGNLHDMFFTEAEAFEMARLKGTHAEVKPLYTTRPQAREPLTDEQKDAARYRWLRNPTTDVSLVLDKRTNWVPPDENVPGVGGYWEYEYRAGEELDEAIDSAIEAAHGIAGEKK